MKISIGMSKNDVNDILKGKIIFEDDVYLGNNYKHNWKCGICKEESFSRTYSEIKWSDNYDCLYCRRGCKRTPSNISEILVNKGITKEDFNKASNNLLVLKDDVYLGATHMHTWKCPECGDEYINSFNRIKNSKKNKCFGIVCKNYYVNQIAKDKSDIKIVENLSKNDINYILRDYVTLKDDIFKGVLFNHTWICHKCGKEFQKQWNEMKRRRVLTTYCQECNREKAEVDYTGVRNNNWHIKHLVSKNPKKYLCECTLCGNEYTMRVAHIIDGTSTRCLECVKTLNGLGKTRQYKIWVGIVDRCNNSANKSYDYYGGRGISLCEEWTGKEGFYNFYKWSLQNGYKDNLSIDRIDVNGNYEPSNCRWATFKEQMNNTRGNVFFEFNGERKTIAQWSEYFNIEYSKMRYWLHNFDMEYVVNHAIEKVDWMYE